MIIRFSKRQGTVVLTCVRRDGSTTYSKSAHGEFFALHDLMHFAVESILDCRDSFFGLIAQGWGIPLFNESGTAARLPAQAIQTELIVGQLQQEAAFGTPSTAADFNRTLTESWAQRKAADHTLRLLTEQELSIIRQRYAELLWKYRSLEA